MKTKPSKKSKLSEIQLEAMLREKERMLRRNRTSLLFNDYEMDALNACMEKVQDSSRSAFMRKAVMEAVMNVLGESSGRLF